MKRVRAFTMIELIIVLAVIAVISLIGYSAFFSSRMNITIELAHEDLRAELHKLRTQTQREPTCATVTFARNGVPRIARTAIVSGACAPPTAAGFQPIIQARGVHVEKILLDESEVDSVGILFTSPRGNFTFTPDAQRVSIELAIARRPAFSRMIELEAASGRIE